LREDLVDLVARVLHDSNAGAVVGGEPSCDDQRRAGLVVAELERFGVWCEDADAAWAALLNRR
jgi:hypothetical protein